MVTPYTDEEAADLDEGELAQIEEEASSREETDSHDDKGC